MKQFKATYTPPKLDKEGNFAGFDKEKAEKVLVIEMIPQGEEFNPDFVFVHSDGSLGMATMACFSECECEWGSKP